MTIPSGPGEDTISTSTMFNGLRTTGGGDAPWPYLTTNITGNRNLLEWCWELEIARFVLVSTTASRRRNVDAFAGGR